MAGLAASSEATTVHSKMEAAQRGTIDSYCAHSSILEMRKRMAKGARGSRRDLLHQAEAHVKEVKKTSGNNRGGNGGNGSNDGSDGQGGRDGSNNLASTALPSAQYLKDRIFSVEHFDAALEDITIDSPRIAVLVSYTIDHVLRIDQVALTFMAKFSLSVEWNDPRLVNYQGASSPNWDDPSQGYFDPEVECTNGVDLEECSRKTTLVNPNTGLVRQDVCLRGNLVIKETSFSSFPWDYMDLRICLASKKYPVTAVILVSYGHSIIHHHPREEWALAGTRTEVYSSNPALKKNGLSYSEMHIAIMVERDASWNRRNVLATMSLFWSASMVVIFMPFSTYDALGYRMETAIALLLSSVAAKFSVMESLPKVKTVTIAEAHMNSSFLGILGNIFTSLFLYLFEKYADEDALTVSRSDSARMQWRRDYFGGQPCSYGAMVTGYVILYITLSLYVVWHAVMMFWIYKAWQKKRRWRTLALPESVALCGKPLPSILTQFNGQDTAIAKANAALGKWAHRMHLEKMIPTTKNDNSSPVESKEKEGVELKGGGGGGAGLTVHSRLSWNSAEYRARGSSYSLTDKTLEILKENSLPQESVNDENEKED
jgi:hypothetical protein